MFILFVIGFVTAIFTFSMVASFFWETLPKWLGLEEEKHWPHEPKVQLGWMKKILGWLYMIGALPIGWALGAGAGYGVFSVITGF